MLKVQRKSYPFSFTLASLFSGCASRTLRQSSRANCISYLLNASLALSTALAAPPASSATVRAASSPGGIGCRSSGSPENHPMWCSRTSLAAHSTAPKCSRRKGCPERRSGRRRRSTTASGERPLFASLTAWSCTNLTASLWASMAPFASSAYTSGRVCCGITTRGSRDSIESRARTRLRGSLKQKIIMSDG